jgi:hypothetical protein
MSTDILSLELSSILKIKRFLDSCFGTKDWANWEIETIALELNSDLSPILVDKLSFLKILHMMPLQVYEDPVLFHYAAEAINNSPVDFDTLPHLTLLEAAYAIHSINAVMLDNKAEIVYPIGITKTCAYILRQEGCSVVPAPFGFVPSTEVVAGQMPSDIESKKRAIAEYIKHMDLL